VSSEGDLRVGRWIIRAGVLLGGTLLAGRFSGLLREVQLAAIFGVSVQADAAVLLLTLPDLMVNVLLSGGLTAALMPRLRALPLKEAQVLMRQILLFVFFIFVLFAIVLVSTPYAWFSLLAPGLPVRALPSMAAIFAVAIAMPLSAAAGVTTASLNSLQKFLVAGCGTLIFNVAVIAALALVSKNFGEPLMVLGIGIAAGATLRLFSQLVILPRGWLIGAISPSVVDARFIGGFITTAATASLILLVPVIVRSLASTVSPGAISAFNYATKLFELPAGVLITSLATLALARLSAHHGIRDLNAARLVLHDGVRSSLCNAVGSGILIAYFANTLVQLAFGRGAMDLDAIARVVKLIQITMIGLPFLALASMAMAELNARERPLLVFQATLGCLILLPILALPGIGIGSESLLACSVVAFQVLHAVWLARMSGLIVRGGWGWLDRKFVISIFIVFGLIITVIFLDLFLQSLPQYGGFTRGVLAILAIGATVVVPQRYLARKRQ
jgi:putative peptidoglycan lipid II flippase